MFKSYFIKLQQASKKLNILFGTVAIMLLIAATALTFAQQEWASRINEWQMKTMGQKQYFPALTICMLALPPLILLIPLKLFLIKLEQKKQQTT